MEEARVIAFTAYKRTDGFEISLTFRGNDLSEVAGDLDKALTMIKEKGGTPVSKSYSKGTTTPSGGMCKVHSVEMKLNKNGTPYHTKGKYPDLIYCNGRGYKDEQDDVNF